MTTESAHPFEPIDGISEIIKPFSSIAFAYAPLEQESVVVKMHGERSLHLRFTGVIALRYEDDCPGFDDPPLSLFPRLRSELTFPLLRIKNSKWAGKWNLIHGNTPLTHFVLLSLDDLVQLIALPNVTANWE